ncbi:RNA-binding protein 25-like [Physella acuta]|uniref:RNA-binding protein 25-like n=1 Tax=Physella acuta TaxID=109671 RepID=UPI0027DCB39C|nr:RNA-binding protein 25-like [Physella acuta]
MGNCVSVIRKKKEPNKTITLAIVGLDNAGKSTLTSVLTGEQPDPDIAPTVGFRTAKFSQLNFDVTLFDVGGGKNIRPIWKNYFGEVYGILYVLDSGCESRMREAMEVFKHTLEHPQVSGKPVLVLANKVDMTDHMEELEIIKGLDLENIVNDNNCPSKLAMVSALKGVGSKMDKEILNGLQWLFDKIQESWASLSSRVEEDMKTAKEARDKEREERRERVKKQREEREKAEELERTRLGLEKKEEPDDDDDIVDGNPFKALDLEQLKRKEKALKEEKKQKQDRLNQLNKTDSIKTRNGALDSGDNGVEPFNLDKNYHLHSGKERGSLEDPGIQPSMKNVFSRSSARASTLPPLEPLGSQENKQTGTEKKKQRKKKKFADYNVDSGVEQDDDDDDGIGKLNQVVNDRNSWGRDPVHNLTPRDIHPKKTKLVKVNRIEEAKDEDHYSYGGDVYTKVHKLDRGDFQRTPPPHNKKESKGYETFPHDLEKGDSTYRRTLKGISPPNLQKFDEEKDGDESTERENFNDNSGDERFMSSRFSKMPDRQPYERLEKDSGRKGKQQAREKLERRDVSDEENDSYAQYNSLEDTLRFPPSPTEDDPPRDFYKEIKALQERNFKGFKKNDLDVEDETKNIEKRENLYHMKPMKSNFEDENGKGGVSDRSETRRKKKRNLLRSNKLAPADDEFSSKFGSPRMVQEKGSRNTSDSDTPVKSLNSKLTQIHRNKSQDSDFETKWGFAEDLPAIDDNYNVRRIPNFNDSDDGDIVY